MLNKCAAENGQFVSVWKKGKFKRVTKQTFSNYLFFFHGVWQIRVKRKGNGHTAIIKNNYREKGAHLFQTNMLLQILH